MKNLHKKIIAVALVLGSPVLSQGLVIVSNSSSSNKKKIVRQLGIDEFQVYCIVKIYEEDNRYNNYDAIYFGKYMGSDVLKKYKDSKRYREFNDRKKFVEILKSGGFKIHQRRGEDIIVKIEKYYFKFFFDLSNHQRIMLPMREDRKSVV